MAEKEAVAVVKEKVVRPACPVCGRPIPKGLSKEVLAKKLEKIQARRQKIAQQLPKLDEQEEILQKLIKSAIT